MIDDEIRKLLTDVTKIHEEETSLSRDYELLCKFNERILQQSIIYHTFYYEISNDEYISLIFLKGLEKTVRDYKKALRRCKTYDKKNY